MKQFLLVSEQVFIRVGAVLGVIATILLLRAEIAKPGPPRLNAEFLLSSSDALNYAQEMLPPEEKYTGGFPLGITIRNTGSTSAKNVVVTLLPGRELQFKFGDLLVESSNIATSDGFKPIHRVRLGDINPGDKVFLYETIWCRAINISRMTVQSIAKSGTERKLELAELRIIFDLEVRLSAENVGSETRHLYLTTGIEEQFKNNNKTYYTFRDGKITIHNDGT